MVMFLWSFPRQHFDIFSKTIIFNVNNSILQFDHYLMITSCSVNRFCSFLDWKNEKNEFFSNPIFSIFFHVSISMDFKFYIFNFSAPNPRNLKVRNLKSIKMLTWKRPQKSNLKKTRFSHSHKPKIIEISSVVIEKSKF